MPGVEAGAIWTAVRKSRWCWVWTTGQLAGLSTAALYMLEPSLSVSSSCLMWQYPLGYNNNEGMGLTRPSGMLVKMTTRSCLHRWLPQSEVERGVPDALSSWTYLQIYTFLAVGGVKSLCCLWLLFYLLKPWSFPWFHQVVLQAKLARGCCYQCLL